MKKMPRSVYLSLFLLIVGVIAGGILAGINMLTAPIIEENKLKELQASFAEIGVTITATEDAELLDGVTGLYSGTFEGKEAFVITTSNANKYTTVNLITVVEKSSGSVLTAKVSGQPNITTHGFDGSFTNSGLGLIGATSGADLNNVSGASVSTDSVRACLDLAISQFAAVAGSVTKPTTAKLNSTVQVTEKDVFNKFTANLTVNSQELTNQTVNIVFTYDFTAKTITFVSSDIELDEDVKSLCMSKIKFSSVDYIESYNAETGEYTVITNNSFGSVLTTVVKVDAEGVIENYSVTANPSFTVNWNVEDSAFDSLIGSVEGTNIANSSELSNVSNATVTTKALKAALELVNQYIALGGNE